MQPPNSNAVVRKFRNLNKDSVTYLYAAILGETRIHEFYCAMRLFVIGYFIICGCIFLHGYSLSLGEIEFLNNTFGVTDCASLVNVPGISCVASNGIALNSTITQISINSPWKYNGSIPDTVITQQTICFLFYSLFFCVLCVC